MKKIFLSLIAFLLTVPTVFAAEIEVNSNIHQVTVYPDSALVTRKAEFSLSEGTHSVVIENVVPRMDENSLNVAGTGTAAVKIFGVQMKKQYLKAPANERVKELERQIEEFDDRIKGENNKIRVLDEEKAFLNSVKLFSGQQLPKDLVTRMPAADELNGILTFLVEGFQRIEKDKEMIRIKVRDLTREKDVLIRELNQIRGRAQRMQRRMVVDLECTRAGKLTLELSYLVYGVSWRPVYDARVNFQEGQVLLSSFALIKQSTGEDWNNVTLTISTAKPSIGGRMPELSPWILRPYQPRRMRQDYKVMARASKQFSVGLESADKFSDQEMKVAEEAPAELAIAQSVSTGVNVVYQIRKPVDIQSDGSEHRVGVTAQRLSADFEYAATPKLSPYAYLRSKVTNAEEGNLLPGEIKVFLDGSYVGSSRLSKTIGAQETFDLYLGVDEALTVKRELIEKKTDDTLIGGIRSPNKTSRYVYKITLENYKSRTVKLHLFDQVPVAEDDKIRVKNTVFKPKPLEEDYKDRKGILHWAFDLKPKQKKIVEISFIVEHPRNLEVGGL